MFIFRPPTFFSRPPPNPFISPTPNYFFRTSSSFLFLKNKKTTAFQALVFSPQIFFSYSTNFSC